ncbi:DciA family protein [Streptomyces sp. NPDC056707]|uniref:DciA family protein n=1 Tax=Streptomyces sp. NPDC056707 TaxID=3345919 RepID=UPI003684B91B
MGSHRPRLAPHVTAGSYDPDSGQLTVCPKSATWATQTRLEQTRIIAAANKVAGRTVVSALRILPPGAAPAPGPADVAPADPVPAAPTGPARTREAACEGYRRALAAHQSVAPAQRLDRGIAEAVERQTRAMRESRHWAFPEPETVPKDAPVPFAAARVQRRRESRRHRGGRLGYRAPCRAAHDGLFPAMTCWTKHPN